MSLALLQLARDFNLLIHQRRQAHAAALAMDAWEEGKHPRGEGGKFAKTFSAHVKAAEKHKAKKERAEERAKNSKAGLLNQASEVGATAKKRWTKAQIRASIEKHFSAKVESKEAAASRETGQLIEAAPAFKPRKGKPIGGEAQNYVLEHGRKTGFEHLIAIGKNGKPLAPIAGSKTGVGITPELDAAIRDHGESVVIHHNHPSNNSLSGADIHMLTYPGLASVWAHGHEGGVYKAELHDNAKGIARDPSKGQLLWKAHCAANDAMTVALHKEYKFLTQARIAEANKAYWGIVNHVLALAKIINYHSSSDAAGDAEKVFYGDERIPSSHDRPADAIRHPGELGSVLGGSKGTPERDTAKAGIVKAGRKNGSRKEGLHRGKQ